MRDASAFLWFHYGVRELDFVYRTTGNDFVGVETAYQSSPSFSDVAHVSQVKRYFLLARDEYGKQGGNSMLHAVPVSLFLAVLDQGSRSL
jgi:hypothetical protein